MPCARGNYFMRKAIVTALMTLFVAQGALAQATRSTTTASRPSSTTKSGNFGLGVMLGDPSGLTAKVWTSRATAFQLGLSYSWGDYFAILGDHLWHFPNALAGAGGGANQFVPYLGLGAVLFFDDDGNFRDRNDRDVALGARIPLGIEFLPRAIPLGVFAEVVPGVGIVPDVFGFVQGDIGARFYF